jgi:phosphopantetheinyl transferase
MTPSGLQIRYLPASDWPADDQRRLPLWLGAHEARELSRLGNPQRRKQWIAGRWTAKQLVRQELAATEASASLSDIQIHARDEQGRGVRPRIVIHGNELAWSLSISHNDEGVLVALLASDDVSLGIDLATTIAPTLPFLRAWFTTSEQQWIAADPSHRCTLLWALKEAAYKACHNGEVWSPRDIEIQPQSRDRYSFVYRNVAVNPCHVQVSHIANQLMACVCVPREMCGDQPKPTSNNVPSFQSPPELVPCFASESIA